MQSLKHEQINYIQDNLIVRHSYLDENLLFILKTSAKNGKILRTETIYSLIKLLQGHLNL